MQALSLAASVVVATSLVVGAPAAATRVPRTLGHSDATERWTGTPTSLDLRGADLEDFLRIIARESGLNVVIDPAVRGKTVTLVLEDVPWDQALDIVLRTQGLAVERSGPVLRVASSAQLSAQHHEEARLAELVASRRPLPGRVRFLHSAPPSAQAALRFTAELRSLQGGELPPSLRRPHARATRADDETARALLSRWRTAGTAPMARTTLDLLQDVPVELGVTVGGVTADESTARGFTADEFTARGFTADESTARGFTARHVEPVHGDGESVVALALVVAARRDGSRAVVTVRVGSARLGGGASRAGWHADAAAPQVILLPGSGPSRRVLVLRPS